MVSANAKEFVANYLDELCRVLFTVPQPPTEQVMRSVGREQPYEVIDRFFDLEENHDIQETSDDSSNALDSCDTGTDLYLRIALPPDMRMDTISNEKVINNKVIKFGITHSMSDRSKQYIRNGHDGGYMRYYVRIEGQWSRMIESMLRKKYESITVYNSREYVDAESLARQLNFKYTFLYESYMHLVNLFYREILSLVHFASDTAGYGTLLTPYVEQTHVTSRRNDGSLGQCVGNRVSYKPTPITPELAAEYGLTTDQTQKSSGPIGDDNGAGPSHFSASEVPNSIVKSINNNVVVGSSPLAVNKKRSVISVDIVTGQERVFDTPQMAADTYGIGYRVLTDAVIGKRRQVNGLVFHHENERRWVPPLGFIFRTLDKDEKIIKIKYVVATTPDGERFVYENKREAARILGYNEDYLKFYLSTKNIGVVPDRIRGYVWNYIGDSEVGDMVQRETPITVLPEDNKFSFGENKKCHGKVIAYNPATKKETEFSSVTAVTERIPTTVETLLTKAMGKRVVVAGHVFRWKRSDVKWRIPTNLQFDPEIGFIGGNMVAWLDEKNEVEAVYPNIAHMVRNRGICASKIRKMLGKDTPGIERAVYATEEMMGPFVPVDECPIRTESSVGYLREETSATAADEEKNHTATGASGRSKGGVIAYDFRTGKTIKVYKSLDSIKKDLARDVRFLRKTLVDKPRQYGGVAYRYSSNQKRWRPPSYFVSDGVYTPPSKHGESYIVGEVDGKPVVMYDSRLSALRIEGIKHIQLDGKSNGKRWRYAEEDEYNVWVDV